MFSSTLHTDFARQVQQDRLAGIRIERHARRDTSGTSARLFGRLFRRTARALTPVPEGAAPVSA